MPSIQQNLEASNKDYVSSKFPGPLPLPPSEGYAVVTCMDARIDPAAQFGIPLGGAHVVRNAGGSVKEAFRSLVISQQILNTKEVLVIKHTDCGMLQFQKSDAITAVKQNAGEEGVREVEDIEFLTFPDLEEEVKKDVEWLKGKLVEKGIVVSGWVYDVQTGTVKRITA
ncbi:carbonic anhydrase [Patellaria atrata CBS 101060]|uniref:Carbonic anhydrase n=1 Tax=Patellaria atrata CBS 101060 TaxID=1346257 RepID=A0A9P4VM71_9PEZI|nr:carbonic anhydrase [Patellaria atrata CBS 101060]